MVVFTCNHCGDSLNKPKVEKHYMLICKTVKSLTCVDCFKDFRGEEYVSHIKCLTEEERYAAKGTTFKTKKGMVKQESWMEMIKSIIDHEPNIPPSIRNLLDSISTYNNIPRTKPKFVNFIKSAFGGRINMKDIEDVWNIIEKYKNQFKANRQRNTNTSNGKLQENSGDNIIVTAVKDSKNGNNEKKKRKVSDEEVKEDVPKNKKHKNDEIPVQNSEEDLSENKVFRFQDKILEVLSKKQSISLKKLEKKVLNAYLKVTGETEVTPKIIKKFNKKLKKVPNLEITDEHVTLLETQTQ